MTNEERKNYRKNNFWPALVGIVGFMMLYAAVCTEDARDTLPQKQADELASTKTTSLLGAGGAITMLSALAWAKKRNRNENER